MKKLINFEDYLFNQIFESKKETSIVLSDRLHNLIKNIHHPIAKRLEDYESANFKGDKATLIDFDDKNFGNFTYTVPGKLIDYIEKEQPDSTDLLDNADYLRQIGRNIPDLWTKYRSPISIGKLIGKLFPGEYKPALEKDKEGNYTNEGRDIESFTNLVKVEREETTESMDRFKIVEGEDIVKYYLVDNYDSNSLGSGLGGSCMKGRQCSDYIGFYAKNNGVRLVIFMSEEEEDKIMGRALLWNIAEIDEEEVDREFMDRIYYIYETDMNLFMEFARRNGWLYKRYQDMNESTSIIDTTTGKESRLRLKTVSTFEEHGTYPFMDTMKYYHYNDNFLTNSDWYGKDQVYYLESTHGDYDDLSGIYVEYYGDVISEDELTYCQLGDEYRRDEDATWINSLGEYATEKYIENNLVWSEREGDYLDMESAYFSEYHGDYLSENDAIQVYENGAASEEDIEDVYDGDYDYRSQDDIGKNVIEYEDEERGTLYFDEDDEEYFEHVESILTGQELLAHKVWDKDRIIRYNGRLYLDDAGQEEKDELLGQKRINFDEKG